MADLLEKEKVYKSILEKVKIPPGSTKVLIKIMEKTTDERTPSGIFKISEMDADWNVSAHRNRTGVVMAVPKDPLPFKVGGDLSPRKTTVQISVGMTVWFDFMDTETYEDEDGVEYKLVEYSSIYVATVPRCEEEDFWFSQKSTDGKEWIIPLNGFHIFDRVFHEPKSKFDIHITRRVNNKEAIFKYVAVNNAAYETGEEEDHVTLEPGDRVQF